MVQPLGALGVFLLASSFLAACSGGGGSNDLSRLRDTEGDGLPDALERKLGSDARDAEDPFVEGAEDDDTAEGPGPDAIPDGLERHLRAGGSFVPITAQSDSDADGVPDYLEVASGLDWRDPDEPALGGAHDRDDIGGPAFDGISDGLAADGAPHSFMATRLKRNGQLRLYLDGLRRGSDSTRGNATLDCSDKYYIGSNNSGSPLNDSWTGDLLELCAYDHVLNTVERLLVDAYLAGRYGVQLARTLYAFGETHGGDVAGIGRESATEVIAEAEGPGILRVSSPSALSDGDYLLWGTDAAGSFALSTDVPPPFEHRLERAWAYTITDGGDRDGVGTVNLRFRVTGLFLSTKPEDFALLFDADGTFADAELYPDQGIYDPALDAIEFRNVFLPPERFFTLAVRQF